MSFFKKKSIEFDLSVALGVHRIDAYHGRVQDESTNGDTTRHIIVW